MTTITKKLITTVEAHRLLPGKGRAVFDKFIAARWLAPCVAGRNPFYRTVDLEACINRLEAGETPQPVYVWLSGMSINSFDLVGHLVLNGKAACGVLHKEWVTSGRAEKQCTRCQGAAKSLRVEGA